MNKTAQILINYLDKKGLLVASSNVYNLFSFASVEAYKDKIMEAANQNPRHFNEWFGGQDRVVIELNQSQDSGEDKESALRGEYPEVLEWANKFYGEDINSSSLLVGKGSSGRKFGEKFFKGVLVKLLEIITEKYSNNLNMPPRNLARQVAKSINLKTTYQELMEIITSTFSEDDSQESEAQKFALIREIARTAEDIFVTQKDYMNDPMRAGKGQSQYKIVISQSPIDIAGMSTDRNWTSCTELGVGCNSASVFQEIRNGGFVAYLVKANDLEIANPVSRVWARRFENNNGESIALLEESVYGIEEPGFVEAVQAWIDQHQGDVSYGTYNKRGGEYSDTFGDTHLHYPDDFESVKNIFMNTEEYLSDMKDKYYVIDNLYREYGEEFNEDADDWDPALLADIFHLSQDVDFPSKKEAAQYIKNLDGWKWELQNKIDEDPSFYEGGEMYDEDSELTPLGNDIQKYISGYSSRFQILKVSAEEQIRSEVPEVRSALFRKSLELKDEMTEEFARYLFNLYKDDLTLSYSSKAREIALTYPNFFTQEELERVADNNSMSASNYAKMYENMPDGPKKEEVKSFILSRVRGQLDFDTIKELYWTLPEQARNRAIHDASSNRYYLDGGDSYNLEEAGTFIMQISRQTNIPISFTNQAADSFHKTESDPEMSEGVKDRVAKNLINILGAMNADTRAAIEIYKKLIPRINFSRRVHNPHELELNSNYNYIPLFMDIKYALARTGRAGEPLIPLLEEKWKEVNKLGEDDIDTGGWELDVFKAQTKEDILYIIDSIRTGQGYSRKYRMS